MSKLTENELRTLYFNFIHYRDNHCGGMAKMSVSDFYVRNGLRRHVVS